MRSPAGSWPAAFGGARRPQPPPLRRLRRPRRDRPARDRGRRARARTTPSRRGSLAPGQALAVGDYRLTYRSLEERRGRQRDRSSAPSSTSSAAARSSAPSRRARTRTRSSGRSRTRSGSAATSSTGEDLFVIAEQINPDGTVYLRVFVKPLVNLLWLAGVVFLLGSLIALWPDAREQRRLAVRYGAAEASGAAREPRARARRAARRGVRRARRAALPPRADAAPRDLLDEPGELERRRLELAEARDRALARAQGARARPSHRARSPTRTTARSSGRCAARPPRRCGRSSRRRARRV